MKLRGMVCATLLGGLCSVDSYATVQMSSEAEEARQALRDISLHAELIAAAFGAEDIEAVAREGAETWGSLGAEAMQLIYDAMNHEAEALALLNENAQSIGNLAGELMAQDQEFSRQAEDPDWPEAECELGLERSASWVIPDVLVNVTQALRYVAAGSKLKCAKIEIEEITAGKFGFGAGKEDEHESCRAELEVCGLTVTPEHYEGRGLLATGGSGGSLVAIDEELEKSCEAIETAVVVLERLQAVVTTFRDCWKQGTVVANNGRLTEIRAQLEVVQGKLDVLRRLVVEGNLAVRGGLRLGSLYLPEDEDGALEIVRGYTQEAISKTEEAGYKMKPEIQRLWDQAETFREAGDYKRAFDRYRAAYSRATVKSFKLVASP